MDIVPVSNEERVPNLLRSDGLQLAAGSIAFSSIEGQAERYAMNYGARLPYPKSCLDSIDAAFYLYDRKNSPDRDKIVLISHGYTWM